MRWAAQAKLNLPFINAVILDATFTYLSSTCKEYKTVPGTVSMTKIVIIQPRFFQFYNSMKQESHLFKRKY